MQVKKRKLKEQLVRAAQFHRTEELLGFIPQGKIIKRGKYSGSQLTAQPIERSEQDHIKANLKGMTTRGSGRKPSMPKMPWDKDEQASKD